MKTTYLDYNKRKKSAVRAAFFLISLTVLLASLFVFFDRGLRDDTESLVKSDLLAQVRNRASILTLWLKNRERAVVTFCKSRAFQNEVFKCLDEPQGEKALEDFLNSFGDSERYQDFLILSKEGKVLWNIKDKEMSFSDIQIQKILQSTPNTFHSLSRLNNALSLSQGNKKLISYYVVSPMRRGTSDETEAYTLVTFTADVLVNKALSHEDGIGNIFLVTDKGDVLVPDANKEGFEFHSQLLTNEEIKSGGLLSYPKADTIIKPSTGIREHEVLRSWTFLSRWNVGILYEVQQESLLGPLLFIRRTFWLLGGIVLLLTLSIIVYYSTIVLMQSRVQRAEKKLKDLGQYKLQDLIGQGGMGSVYMAEHKLLHRPTAIKLLRSDSVSEKEIEHFQNEVKTVCHLSNPHTIAVYDYGRTDEGVFYYAMEYLEGFDLNRFHKNFGNMPYRRVVHILLQVCSSIKEAHGEGLIHRDIKPANLLLTKRGGILDMTKVLDFGLVRNFTAPSDNHQSLSGTPHFMPKEAILTPGEVDHLVDIYAIGMTAYFLLSGTYPYPDYKKLADLLNAHKNDEPQNIEEHEGVVIPKELSQLIMSCIARNKADRPQSVTEVITILEKCAALDPWTQEEAAIWWNRYELMASNKKKEVASVPIISEHEVTIQVG